MATALLTLLVGFASGPLHAHPLETSPDDPTFCLLPADPDAWFGAWPIAQEELNGTVGAYPKKFAIRRTEIRMTLGEQDGTTTVVRGMHPSLVPENEDCIHFCFKAETDAHLLSADHRKLLKSWDRNLSGTIWRHCGIKSARPLGFEFGILVYLLHIFPLALLALMCLKEPASDRL